jgi:hypothetical protein
MESPAGRRPDQGAEVCADAADLSSLILTVSAKMADV